MKMLTTGPGPESGGDFVSEEQLEVARNGAVHQASCRWKADRFALSSATKLPPEACTGLPTVCVTTLMLYSLAIGYYDYLGTLVISQ